MLTSERLILASNTIRLKKEKELGLLSSQALLNQKAIYLLLIKKSLDKIQYLPRVKYLSR
jgi:hypothetical protein